jgi:hypothetical protein
MGLDISLRTSNQEFDDFVFSRDNYFKAYSLSRDFCHLMCRRDVIIGPTELDQIGVLTAIDIEPLFLMNTYTPIDEFEEYSSLLDAEELDAERKKVITTNRTLEGNLPLVFETVSQLILKLSQIKHLGEQLSYHEQDRYWIQSYFSNFNANPGNGYIGNNFGQDLRNFKAYLELAENYGEHCVYFTYG